MSPNPLHAFVIGIKGAGEMASAVAWRLFKANMCRIFMMEIPRPLAVRRRVCFCEAVHDEEMEIEGVKAIRAESVEDFHVAWGAGQIAVIVDPRWSSLDKVRADVVVDAILAKRNLGTTRKDAPLVIALGPGFTAGDDAHVVVRTEDSGLRACGHLSPQPSGLSSDSA